MGHWQALPTSSGPLQAWREDPEGTPHGAVVVVQEIFGVTDHIRAVCAQLAAAGFVALAPAFFDRLEPGTVLPYDAEGTARGRELVARLGLEEALAVAAAAAAVGGVDRLTGVLKVTGFVASTPEFTGQPGVINGASEVLGEIFGDAGRHARSAVGVPVLPLDAPVEVEVVFTWE